MFAVEVILRERQPLTQLHVHATRGTDGRGIVAVRIGRSAHHQRVVLPLVTARLVDATGLARRTEASVTDAERRPYFVANQLFPGAAGALFDHGTDDGVAQVGIRELADLRGRRPAEIVHGHGRALRAHALLGLDDGHEWRQLIGG